MMFIMITKVRRRMRTIVRAVVVVLVTGILVSQLFTLDNRMAADIPKEERPSGQPLRVENPQTPLMDQFVVKWKEWTNTK